MTRLPLYLLRCLILWIALAAPLQALEVRQTIWGFHGFLVPNCFNPVSVLIENPAPGTFDGQLVLGASQIAGSSHGIENVQPLYLSPRTTRWVQFHVFVGNRTGNYALRWGPNARDRFAYLDEVKIGAPGAVWLRDAGNPFAPIGSLKSFPDELFPTTVSATESLRSVVLDHAPQWEPARREAFLDWLKLGGTVHLLPGADGKNVVFGSGLEALNNPADDVRHGAGKIQRHAITAREMSEQYLSEHGDPAPTLSRADSPATYDFEAEISRTLSALTRPKVSWMAINILAVAYIAVIGPLHFRFRRRLDYRVSILAFLGAVALFGSAFAIVGRRGYGESQIVNSVTIARSLGGGRFDTTQWISAFATRGDFYTLTHKAAANLYGTGGDAEAGACRILNGRDGSIQLDIPLYSSRSFLHRGVMSGNDTSFTVEKRDPNGSGIGNLRIVPGPSFPKGAMEARLLWQERIYELTLQNGAFEASGNQGEPFGTAFSRDRLSTLLRQTPSAHVVNPDFHQSLLPVLMARALHAPELFQQTIQRTTPPSDVLTLCVTAPAPASFSLQGPGFERERGWVVYLETFTQP